MSSVLLDISVDDDLKALIAAFLEAEKTSHVTPRWRTKQHSLYAEAQMVVGVAGTRRFGGIVYLTAHRVRMPPKYGFALSFRGHRVLALDVSPGRIHRNLLTPGAVGGTHWQCWPNMEAEPDNREMPFSGWLKEFLRRCNIVPSYNLKPPPRGVQLRLIDGDKANNG